jgi:hypothetical protein
MSMGDYFAMNRKTRVPFGRIFTGIAIGAAVLYGGCHAVGYAASAIQEKAVEIYALWQNPDKDAARASSEFPAFQFSSEPPPQTLDDLVGKPLKLPNGMTYKIVKDGPAVQGKYAQYLKTQEEYLEVN